MSAQSAKGSNSSWVEASNARMRVSSSLKYAIRLGDCASKVKEGKGDGFIFKVKGTDLFSTQLLKNQPRK